jgi:GH35 family endo-1,4-beta-xylanase
MDKSCMDKRFWALWNDEEQARIDADIEKYRKADAVVDLPELADGATVKIEQISHKFIFGAHIFNFEQLGSKEANDRYKELYGTLFNSATIPFYWKKFEMEEGKPRHEPTYEDSEEFWNNCKNPKEQPHWRRPVPKTLIKFCKEKGIRIHGHPLVWSNYNWHVPRWLIEKLPEKYKASIDLDVVSSVYDIGELNKLTPREIEAEVPEFVEELNRQHWDRVKDIIAHYKDDVDSWDVVNESGCDYHENKLVEGDKICKSTCGFMPGDYTYRSFKLAQELLPEKALLNINDWFVNKSYKKQIEELIERGCKIDIQGQQMHLFNPKDCQDIAEGKTILKCPDELRAKAMGSWACGLPVHLSEITITSPQTPRGEEQQAMILRQFYRLWFSLEPMMGITWWNVVDDCGAPGEPSFSGLFHRDMTPKKSYYALNDLINNEWKTRLELPVQGGKVCFRGFRGKYKITLPDGTEKTIEVK